MLQAVITITAYWRVWRRKYLFMTTLSVLLQPNGE